MKRLAYILILAAAPVWNLRGAESDVFRSTGIAEMRLVSDRDAIIPGKPLRLALVIQPETDFHLYWRGPGIVGVPPAAEWTFPDGTRVSEFTWPLPEKVSMVGIEANGFRSEVVLPVEVIPPKKLNSSSFSVKAKVTWMACARSCHPGLAELALTLPVAKNSSDISIDSETTRLIEAVYKEQPPSLEDGWTATVERPDRGTVKLAFTIPEMAEVEKPEFQFFADDLQVNSDEPLRFQWLDRELGQFSLTFTATDFAPKDPSQFSGWLKLNQAWPGRDTAWLDISVPWNPSERKHE